MVRATPTVSVAATNTATFKSKVMVLYCVSIHVVLCSPVGRYVGEDNSRVWVHFCLGALSLMSALALMLESLMPGTLRKPADEECSGRWGM